MKKLILLASIAALSGCSTMTNGTTQQFEIDPRGKSCFIYKDGKKIAESNQNLVEISRSHDTLKIECPESIKEFKPAPTKEAIFGAVWLDFGLIDSITGAFWEYVEVENEDI